jgi:hypothetical protein
MTSIIDKLIDAVFYLFSREKYKFRTIERKIAPVKAKYFEAVEAELKSVMGDEVWPVYLHAQASDIDFLKSVCMLYETGFISHTSPATLVPHLVHGLFIYSTKSKPLGKLSILKAIDIVKANNGKTVDGEPNP